MRPKQADEHWKQEGYNSRQTELHIMLTRSLVRI